MKTEVNGKKAPISMILRVAGLSSAAWYGKAKKELKGCQRGPKVSFGDEEVIEGVRGIISSSYFHGEGYKKLRKRLWTMKGIKVGKDRLLKLLRDNGLLADERPIRNGSSRDHDGTTLTDAPDILWACDLKEWRTLEGKLWMITVLDHFHSGVIHHRTCERATMEPAMDVVRGSVKKRFGEVRKGICEGMELYLRTDHGAQFTGERFKKEIAFLGLRTSKAFVKSPECNGVIERFHRTIKEQIGGRIEHSTKKEARWLIENFMSRYNNHWILHKLNLMSPNQYRKHYEEEAGC